MTAVRLAWQVPLAIGSYLFFKVTRFILRRLATLHFAVLRRDAKCWQIFSEEFLGRPLVLPAVMVEGPRWNTHALIVRAGPLKVERSIEIHLPTAFRSASSWTVVVYRFPGHRTVESIGSVDVSPDDEWCSLAVEPGRYALVLRYYDWNAAAALPEVRVDGRAALASIPVPADANEFYHRLRQRRNLFYRMLHYYVYVLLEHGDRLPHRLVEKEYLPVGNPQTRFAYGIVPRGRRLVVAADSTLLAAGDIYLTLYDRASFPVEWDRLVEPEHSTGPFDQDCMYLVRVIFQSPPESGALEDGLTVQTVS